MSYEVKSPFRGTTLCAVKKDGIIAVAGDDQYLQSFPHMYHAPSLALLPSQAILFARHSLLLLSAQNMSDYTWTQSSY